jgi:O-acetylserine/cysteine efflux transporter
MLLAALRYAFTALPAVFFVRRPAIAVRYCIAYGLSVGVGQFGCLFYAMDIGMPAGAASVVLQSQAFFTLVFAALLLGERIKPPQLAGLAIAVAGLYGVGGGVAAGDVSAIPVPPAGDFPTSSFATWRRAFRDRGSGSTWSA